MKTSHFFMVFVLVFLAGTMNSFAQDTELRANRVGVSALVNFGKSDGDAIAILSISGEYNLWNRLSLGGGYAYLDGYLIQKHSFELFAKGYALAKPFDIFVQAGTHFYSGGVTPVLKAGVEWQTKSKFFMGADFAMMFQTGHTGYLAGIFAGLRF